MACRGLSPMARVHERHAPSRHPWRSRRGNRAERSCRKASRRCRTAAVHPARGVLLSARRRGLDVEVRSRPDGASPQGARCSPTRSCLPRCWTIASRWLWRCSTGVRRYQTPFSHARMRPAPWPLWTRRHRNGQQPVQLMGRSSVAPRRLEAEPLLRRFQIERTDGSEEPALAIQLVLFARV